MISLSEIRNRALKFQKEWEGEKYERGEAQSFWNDFFQIFDVSRRRVSTKSNQTTTSWTNDR